jgi:hypothetical protein
LFDFFTLNGYNYSMTLNVEIYEMNYAVSPGGIDCWETTIQGYGQSTTISDFISAGDALNYVIDKHPTEMLELTVMSLPAYEKEMLDV